MLAAIKLELFRWVSLIGLWKLGPFLAFFTFMDALLKKMEAPNSPWPGQFARG
jgi:hypothetical protein